MFGKKAETEVVEEVERELKFKEWFNLKGIRAEIKNVNSFRAIQRAIEYEIERQAEILAGSPKSTSGIRC